MMLSTRASATHHVLFSDSNSKRGCNREIFWKSSLTNSLLADYHAENVEGEPVCCDRANFKSIYQTATRRFLTCKSLQTRAAYIHDCNLDRKLKSMYPCLAILSGGRSDKSLITCCSNISADFTREGAITFPATHKLKQRRHWQARAASGADMPVDANATSSQQTAIVGSSLGSFLVSERAKVVGMVALALALCNMDRVVMSVAIVPFSSTFNWSSSFSGVVQSSFLWGYFMSPIAAGALADHYGGKGVMACGVALWSLATLLTPWAANHSLGMLLGMRTLMGFAEGVALPCMNNMTSRWFPRSERATAVGLSMAGFHLGSAAGLLATPIIIARSGVSAPFIAFGLLGLLWLIFWVSFISKNPESHTHIKRSELLFIQEGSWSLAKVNVKPTPQSSSKLPPFGMLLSKLPTWAIILANAMHNWGYFVILSWMPIYFKTVFGVNLKQAAWFSAVPWAMMGVAGFFAGACSDSLIHSGLTVTTVRKVMQSIGFLGPAMALFGLNAAQNANVAAIWLTAAVGLSAFSQAGFLVNLQEIGPRYTGVLHGMSNTAGTMAAIVSTIGTGYFVQWLGSFQAFLTLTAILYILSALFWNCFATGEQVFD